MKVGFWFDDVYLLTDMGWTAAVIPLYPIEKTVTDLPSSSKTSRTFFFFHLRNTAPKTFLVVKLHNYNILDKNVYIYYRFIELS